MNKKRWFWAGIAAFVAAMILEAIFNAYCLKGVYAQTASLWRPAEEIYKLLPYYWIAAFFVSFIFVYIYSKGYEGKPSRVMEGVRFGFWIGLFINLPMVTITYATLPVPSRLPIDWFVTGMAEYIIVGAVVGLIYKK